MRFYVKQHRFYCGIDLHARAMYICILDQHGEVVLHRNVRATPEALAKALAPYEGEVVVGVECIFSWYWLADYCADHDIPFVLGHALYMKAVHGGKAKNDRIDSLKIAALLRGGTFPIAYAYPRHMRATRDVLRRRMFFVRRRADLMTHIQLTNAQYNLSPIVGALQHRCNRQELEVRFSDDSVRISIEADLRLIDHFDEVIRDLERHILSKARVDDPDALARLQTVPGIGKILALVILYEIREVERFDTVQKFISYSRLVKCARESNGKIYGTGGSKIGNAHLKWAFSEAAVCFLRGNEPGQKLHARLVKKHGKHKGLSVLAAKLGRAVYFMLKREKAFDLNKMVA